jgi:uncharacterized protein YbaR (Trm112 family)
MESISERCPVCRTKLKLVARQPIDEQYETLFFKCPLCAKAEQVVVASDLMSGPEPEL